MAVRKTLKKVYRTLFFGGVSQWYLELSITDENRAAVVEWLDDRAKFHIWITSVITGSIVLFATLGPQPHLQTLPGVLKIVGLCLMLLSVLANIISIWSLSNWKYHVKTGLVTEGRRMRLDLELMAMIAIGSFLLGMLLMVLAVVG